MGDMFDKSNAGGCINSALFWLEGFIDGTTLTRDEALELLTMSIDDLQSAYQRLAQGK